MAFEGWRTWWDNRQKAGKEWREGLGKIWTDLQYIERYVGVGLFLMKTAKSRR
jgi:hypothetical protein